MKFRLKIDLGLHKTGSIIEQDSFGAQPSWATKNSTRGAHRLYFYQEELDALIQQDIVEEIQEPKWTDKDLLELMDSIGALLKRQGVYIDTTKIIDEWKEQKNEQD